MSNKRGFWNLLKKLPCIIGMRCPKCGSWSVEEIKGNNSITKALNPSKPKNFTINTTRCRCKKCGYEWNCVKISSI